MERKMQSLGGGPKSFQCPDRDVKVFWNQEAWPQVHRSKTLLGMSTVVNGIRIGEKWGKHVICLQLQNLDPWFSSAGRPDQILSYNFVLGKNKTLSIMRNQLVYKVKKQDAEGEKRNGKGIEKPELPGEDKFKNLHPDKDFFKVILGPQGSCCRKKPMEILFEDPNLRHIRTPPIEFNQRCAHC